MSTLFPFKKLASEFWSAEYDFKKHIFPLLIAVFVFFGLFFRFWQLSNVPVALYYDEMDYVFAGEAVGRYGTDIAGNWTPFQLRPLQTLNITAELPALFHAVAQILFGFGPERAHYPAAFFGLAGILLVSGLSYHLWKKKMLSAVILVVLLTNPWHIHISRMGYEATIALFFEISFLLGFFLYIDRVTQHAKLRQRIVGILIMIVSLIVGFYTYHGAKFTLLSMVGVSIPLIWWYQKNKKLNLFLSCCLIIIAGGLVFRMHLLTQSGAFGDRSSETILSTSVLHDHVNHKLRTALVFPGQRIFLNKATVFADLFVRQYFSVFDVYRLFVSGMEGGYQFSLLVSGFFYLSTGVFIVIGTYVFWERYREYVLPFLVFFLISPITSAITLSTQSIFRSALTYVLMLVVAGMGVHYILVDWQPKIKHQWAFLLKCFVGMVICFEALLFGYRYFTQYAVLTSENHYFHEELLAGYLGRQKQKTIVVVQGSAYTKIRSYISYNHLMPSLSQEEKKQLDAPKPEDITIGHVTFTQECPVYDEDFYDYVYVVESKKFKECTFDVYAESDPSLNLQDQQFFKAISSPLDSGSYYYLLNDSICALDTLKAFIHTQQLKDFNPVALPDAQYCETWVRAEQ